MSLLCKQMPLLSGQLSPNMTQSELRRQFIWMLGLRDPRVIERKENRVVMEASLVHPGPSLLNAYANSMADAQWSSDRACEELNVRDTDGPVSRTRYRLKWACTPNMATVSGRTSTTSRRRRINVGGKRLMAPPPETHTRAVPGPTPVIVKFKLVHDDNEPGSTLRIVQEENHRAMGRVIALTHAYNHWDTFPLCRVFRHEEIPTVALPEYFFAQPPVHGDTSATGRRYRRCFVTISEPLNSLDQTLFSASAFYEQRLNGQTGQTEWFAVPGRQTSALHLSDGGKCRLLGHIVRGVLHSVHFLLRHKVVHGDISHNNIMFRPVDPSIVSGAAFDGNGDGSQSGNGAIVVVEGLALPVPVLIDFNSSHCRDTHVGQVDLRGQDPYTPWYVARRDGTLSRTVEYASRYTDEFSVGVFVARLYQVWLTGCMGYQPQQQQQQQQSKSHFGQLVAEWQFLLRLVSDESFARHHRAAMIEKEANDGKTRFMLSAFDPDLHSLVSSIAVPLLRESMRRQMRHSHDTMRLQEEDDCLIYTALQRIDQHPLLSQ